jgi:hypothetical protein
MAPVTTGILTNGTGDQGISSDGAGVDKNRFQHHQRFVDGDTIQSRG